MKTRNHFVITLLIIMIAFASCNQNKEQPKTENNPTTVTAVGDDLYPIMENNKVGFIDAAGNIVVEPQFDYTILVTLQMKSLFDNNAKISVFKEDRAFVVDNNIDWDNIDMETAKPIKLGCIDKTGKVIFEKPCTYLEVLEAGISPTFFSEGLAIYPEENKVGYIDKTGEYVIKPQFDQAGMFYEGLAKVKENDVWGFIDKDGNYVIKPQFEEVESFTDGLAEIKIDGKYGFIDKTGKMIVKPEYDHVSDYGFQEDMLLVAIGPDRINRKWGFVDKTGNTIVEPQFDDAWSFSDGMARIIIGNRDNKKYGFIDKTGKVVIEPQYEYAKDFSEGLAAIQENDKWGFIDKTGKTVIEPQFDDAEEFHRGLAVVKKDEVRGIIDKTGNYIVNPQYNTIKNPRTLLATEEEFYLVEKNGKWGILDSTGKTIAEPQFEEEPFFIGELGLTTKDGKSLYINKEGKTIWSSDENLFPTLYAMFSR